MLPFTGASYQCSKDTPRDFEIRIAVESQSSTARPPPELEAQRFEFPDPGAGLDSGFFAGMCAGREASGEQENSREAHARVQKRRPTPLNVELAT